MLLRSSVSSPAQGQVFAPREIKPVIKPIVRLTLTQAYTAAANRIGGATNHFSCINANLIETTNYPFGIWTFSFTDTNGDRASIQVSFDQEVKVDSQSDQIFGASQIVYEDCAARLRAIDGAKAIWALEHQKNNADIPADADLFGLGRYIFKKPVCPQGGAYTLGRVDEPPRCSIPGHTF